MSLLRRALVPSLAAALLASPAAAAAGPGRAPDAAPAYRCATSSRSIDTPSYSGPWADNWDVTVTLCAARSGAKVHAYAKVSWDGPAAGFKEDFFNDAYFTVRVQRGRSVLRSASFHGIKGRLENGDNFWGNHNGSYRTPVVTAHVGRGRAAAHGSLALDWRHHGNGYQRHAFSASPAR
ncbi:hypothetical protein [Streptomyces sp. VRA16 Mangrove soil]|uniref:hypothetical protein n=1 Tax=Streptomyces sp. VRA16 Mangrove soil TaxID=2817434 RepID=UPI001A9E136A|nr:hypothetical protein [Streptomyces sp. VRA16 Mangrove soil]MBO1330924.1 hypothetical protein [Streptomyces sp. VRA16 Mangrove soil]